MLRGVDHQSELMVPVFYKGVKVKTNLRCDMLIDGALAVELKAVDTIMPVHEAQLLTYPKLR